MREWLLPLAGLRNQAFPATVTAPLTIREKAARHHEDRLHHRAGAGRAYPHRAHQRSIIFKDKGSPAEYGARMKVAIERGWLVMHEIAPSCGSHRQCGANGMKRKKCDGTDWVCEKQILRPWRGPWRCWRALRALQSEQ